MRKGLRSNHRRNELIPVSKTRFSQPLFFFDLAKFHTSDGKSSKIPLVNHSHRPSPWSYRGCKPSAHPFLRALCGVVLIPNMATAFVACPVPRGLSVNFGHCEGRAMVKRTRRFRFVPSKTSIQKCPTVISAKQSTCVRCGETFTSHENFPGSCRYHGDIMGNPQPLNLYEGM
ncbi:unnamed protein product [Chondrus crispus]|uniref:Uncharacterized protein n=1 Tax=Chondrus crispus TaxID=2769 RepID=R7QBT5_CHOCR|nr:unnamed protein product [Chondrus crispus]CDF34891.1 unnamed protein product [Chondrus crispus]|eukprot:XP_005714710.1 unnamed protein product [Chondrus crispus]